MLVIHLADVILPRFDQYKNLISDRTAQRWMHNLGLTVKAYSKCLYYDGHERADVILYRHQYGSQLKELCKREVHYLGPYCDQIVYPELEGSVWKIVRVYQNKCTIQTHKEPLKGWFAEKD